MAYYTDKQKEYWASWAVRRADKWGYVIRKGVLGWAIPVFIIVYLIKIKLNFGHFILREFLIGIAVWAFGGLLWGLQMFKTTEKSYKFYLENSEDDDE